ncbi:Secoisolariciresinol dehydrogenase [Nymphaea thermarum]|nr:Secoisolariciresinol dehydrogenase [Nymphaea thermarum]
MSSSQLVSVAQRLKGKVALITGAASGIGLATAKLFHRHGAKVVIADIQDELGEKAYHEISSNGGDGAMYVHCDVTSEEDVAGAVDGTVAKYGKLDIMYNNAGYVGPSSPNVPEIDKTLFEKLLSVHVVGGLGLPAYCASKHAIAGLCKSMAVDLGQFGIRVNCISPYAVFTPIISAFSNMNESEFYNEASKHAFLKGVNLKPEDVAAAALYFASDDSKYTSGHNLVLDADVPVREEMHVSLYNVVVNILQIRRPLKGKVELITGAASGIGLATAKLFHRHGAKVVIADIQDELGEKAYHEISSNGGDGAMYVHCDVTSEEDVAGAVDGTVAKYGKLDIMYNNAGYVGPSSPNVPEIDKTLFEKLLSVHVVGGLGLPAYCASKHAIAGLCGLGLPAYCASKHAIAGLCKSMAVDLGQYGIRVNCISPYAVFTPIISGFSNMNESEFYNEASKHAFLKGVNLKPEDVAAAALYFASDDSKYTSGHNLVLDAGFTIELGLGVGPGQADPARFPLSLSLPVSLSLSASRLPLRSLFVSLFAPPPPPSPSPSSSVAVAPFSLSLSAPRLPHRSRRGKGCPKGGQIGPARPDTHPYSYSELADNLKMHFNEKINLTTNSA